MSDWSRSLGTSSVVTAVTAAGMVHLCIAEPEATNSLQATTSCRVSYACYGPLLCHSTLILQSHSPRLSPTIACFLVHFASLSLFLYLPLPLFPRSLW